MKLDGNDGLIIHFFISGTFVSGDLPDLQNFLLEWSDKWFDIGVQLRVETQRLDNIRHNYPKYEDALREMLIIRLRGQPILNFDMISTALRSPAVSGERRSLSSEGIQICTVIRL